MNTQNPYIIYITGPHAVGKTELSKYLIENMKLELIETGEIVRQEYAKRDARYLELPIQFYVRLLEERSPGYFSSLILQKVKYYNSAKGIIISGMRSAEYLLELKRLLSEYTQFIIWIEVSDYEVLRERYNKREGKMLSNMEFRKLLEIDDSMGLAELKKLADLTLDNTSEIDTFYQEGLKAIKNLC